MKMRYSGIRSPRDGQGSRPLQLFCLSLVLVLCLGLLSGCQHKTKGIEGPSHSLTDCAGRQVEVPDEIDSVSCLYAYAGHACVFLGQEDKLTSIVAGLKRDLLMKRKLADINDLLVPYNDQAINMEELLASDPDVVLLRESTLEHSQDQKLADTGIPCVVIDYTTMAEQMESIQVLGQVFGCQDRAQAYLDYYQDTLDMVKERVADIPEDQRLRVFHSVNEVVRTDVPDSISDEIISAAGLVNVIHQGGDLEAEESKVYATVEQIYLWDPDWILCNEPSATDYFRQDEKMQGLKAVREDRVLQLPIGISRWCHPGSIETPLAVLYLGKALYPDHFEDIDLDKEIKDFYDRFLGLELSASDLEHIHSGKGMRETKGETK